jgi:hypothetical protein
VDKFEAAPLVGFVAVAAAATVILAGTILVLSRGFWKNALPVAVTGIVIALCRGTHPGPLRFNLLLTAILFFSFATALVTQRRALHTGYRPEMKGKFMRALTSAEQRQFMLAFGGCAVLLSAATTAVCATLL